MSRARLAIAGVTASATMSLGCYTAASSTFVPSTHFVYPNSNVTATQTTSGSSHSLCGLLFVNPGRPTGDDLRAAADEAAHKVGSATVINATVDSGIWTFFGLLTVCSTTVSGVGANMVVGVQALQLTEDPQPAHAKKRDDEPRPFDTDVAHRSLERALKKSARCAPENVASPGPGKVRVTFTPDGEIGAVEVLEPYDKPPVASCIGGLLEDVSMPSFEGVKRTVTVPFSLTP